MCLADQTQVARHCDRHSPTEPSCQFLGDFLLCVRACISVSRHTHRCLELELQEGVITLSVWVLGTKPQSSTKGVSSLNH